MLTGEKEKLNTVKELSDRSGRPVIVFIQDEMPRFYTPQKYNHFSPLALTYSPFYERFGMKADRQTHHDYICFLCAYSVRIDNVADVPKCLLYPYITGANNATDYKKKMQLLHEGRMKLNTVASSIAKADGFEEALVNVQQREKQMSESYAMSLLTQKFADRKLCKIDTEGVRYADFLKEILSDHNGDTKVVNKLSQASRQASMALDTIMLMGHGRILTDELLASMKTKSDMVAETFNQCMRPNISVENDIYSWTTLSSMESGNVISTYERHQIFHCYIEDKIQRQKELNLLVGRKNSIGQIGIDGRTTVETVTRYNSKVQHLENDILTFIAQSAQPMPNISSLKGELTKMKLLGGKLAELVSSLEVFWGVDPQKTLCFLVDKVIRLCESISLEEVFSLKIPQLVTIGQALHALDMKTNLQNACFKLTQADKTIVSNILQGNAEAILSVNFRQKTVEAGFVDLQPMGDANISPFSNAIHQWEEINKAVQSVAQCMKAQMVKFDTFSSTDLKCLLSKKLLPVDEYEAFTQQIKLWNITDEHKENVQDIMHENLKFIRVILDEFPDQEDTNCDSMRMFTSKIKLTYTLHEKDSLLNVILSNNTYNLDDDFKETVLIKLDVAGLAYRYNSCIKLQVKDVETLFHYLLSAYEQDHEYGTILYHLSQNSERMALLNHIVEDHVKMTPEDEADTDRVSSICAKYILNFMVPYKASTACMDKTNSMLQLNWTRSDNFLAASSVLNNIMMNRIIQGANIEEASVKIEELARAVNPQRLYTVTHTGKRLSWGRYLPGETSVGCTQEWRNKLLLRLQSKAWNVNIREIIALHKELYMPKKTFLSPEFSNSTFFLEHKTDSLVVWYVKPLGLVTFPTESPAKIKFGIEQFTKQKSLDSAQHSKKDTDFNNGERTPTQLNVPKGGFGKDEVKETETKDSQEKGPLYNMNAITHALKQIDVDPSPQKLKAGTAQDKVPLPTIGWSEPIVHTGINAMCSVGNTFTHTSNRTFTQAQTNTTPNQKPLFVKYIARVNPWNVWRSQSGGGKNPIRHLMQARIQLSDNSSDETEDS